jgi:3-oxoacyl-(acyl-carrier-protein) synthase
MEAALTDAGLTPGQIDYVNAHGTGTVRNDVAEARAIAQVLGTSVPVVSTKSYTGHMLGASGATEAVFVVASLQQQWVPANLDLAPVDPEIDIYLPDRCEHVPLERALSNSFAFGGSNVSLVFSRAQT